MKQSYHERIKTLTKDIVAMRYTNLEQNKLNCNELLEISIREKHVYGITFAETYLGDYNVANGNIIDSIAHLQRAQILASENGFDNLLKVIYNLLGICYEALTDEQTALQYYLKGNQILKKLPDPAAEAVILNNIASNFDQFDDFEEAEKYYTQAYEKSKLVPKSNINFDYIKLRILTNFADSYLKTKDYAKMKDLLDTCSKEVINFDLPKKYLLYRGYCQYYAYTNDVESAKTYAHRFIDLLENDIYDDKYIVSEALYSMTNTLIEINEAELAQKAIDYYKNYVSEETIENIKQLQFLKIKYHEKFEKFNVNSSVYYDYYKIIIHTEEVIKNTKAKGLKNILYLDEVRNALLEEQISLEQEAHLDELTQVYNRRYLNKLISKASTNSNIATLGFVMVDLDFFKEYNDTYGHCMGDSALQSVANVLKQHSNESIQVSRYGGDEFVCVCTNISTETILEYVSKVQQTLATLDFKHETSVYGKGTLSIGISNHILSEDVNGLDILDMADKALYQSKSAGRNTFSLYKG